jgi:hypothetical protein
MMRQTAVEWLIENMQRLNQHESPEEWNKLFEQAKAMEKQQMENAVSNGISKADMVDNRGYFNFDKWYNETYGGDHSVDTNEMIDHIGEANEMVCAFEPTTDTSSSTVCKWCGKEKFLHNHVPDVGKMVSNVEIGKKRWDDWDEFNKKACYPEDYQSAFADGFTRGAKWVNEIAKETLYTEEQVREAIDRARNYNDGWVETENEIIQSLKQSK